MPDEADFRGEWRVERSIADHLSGQAGQFSGLARLEPAPDGGLSYCELGQLRLGDGPALTAERRYLWRFVAGRVEVMFEDGRPFHSFAPEGQGAGTDHPCGADFYQVAYDFTAWPLWKVRWRVTGPRKDYTMHSLYARPEREPVP